MYELTKPWGGQSRGISRRLSASVAIPGCTKRMAVESILVRARSRSGDSLIVVDGNSGKYPEFKGNVATVYTNPISMGGASNGHYGGNAETYMNVGEAMGKAMVELMKNG